MSDCGSDDLNEPLGDDTYEEDDPQVKGITEVYLASVKEKLVKEISSHKMPGCYIARTFWISPPDHFFALKKSLASADGLNPTSLYYPRIFVWLPEFLDKSSITCQNPECQYFKNASHPMTVKGWNDNPIARRVVGLDQNYFIITKRIQCRKIPNSETSGCGKSMNYYDPAVLDQLDPTLVAEFPAFLTHKSGIDKTLMALIRAGVAHRLSSSAWSKVLREMHVREHDLREIKYLRAIQKNIKFKNNHGYPVSSYQPFSNFDNHSEYAGFSPSRWYINRTYMDYMEHIRPALDQCLSALTGYIIKWDHSFKLVKYMTKLNGVTTFAALFTLVNEFEQIRYQAFVPTKGLNHLKAGLEEFIAGLRAHGLAEPILGFTDNVASDAGTFLECIPSFNKNVEPISIEEFSDLPRLTLPEDVSIISCNTEAEISNACLAIIEGIGSDEDKVHIGFDMEWEFSTGISGSGPQKTALIQLALPKSVYLLRVYSLKKLPASFQTLLMSEQIIKIGRNIGADFSKIARDFPEIVLPPKHKKSYQGVIELGKLAFKKNAIPNGKASLAVIVASTLQRHLSKESRSSEWTATTLDDDQIQYAALDAYAALMVWEVLETFEEAGKPLSSITKVGDLVSLYVRKQEVAQGIIVEQPSSFTIQNPLPNERPISLNVSTTKTRALIQIDTILAPNCVIPHHRQSLKNIQNGQDSFNAVVNITSLRTRSGKEHTTIPEPSESRNIGIVHPIKPPSSLTTEDIENHDINAESESDDEEEDPISENNIENLDRSSGFTQQPTDVLPSRILADVFHEIDKVCRTISKKHTLCRKFATAFSDTLLVPDEDDKKAVSEILEKKKSSFNKVRSKSPAWLWKRVRRYIPEKGILELVLNEFFNSWGHIKCSVTRQELFSAETWKKTQGVLHDVRKGWLSDPGSISVYIKEGVDKDGLPLYHCIRGTNSVEGAIHNPIRRNFASLNASPELADALIADFRHRHNTDMGSLHKSGIQYGGHYDPWLDHEISKLQADIVWTVCPIISPSRLLQDTDPLNFEPTKERFGITAIPPLTRIANEFFAYSNINQEIDFSSNQLWLSKLTGKRKNIYAFLAMAQQTKYAVTPLHTEDEFNLFHSAVSPGGQWASANGQPNFDKMAQWWSEKANGKTIFYKLREHLAAHYKIWSEHRKEKQTMIASQPQRKPHEKRIRSKAYVSHVLPPAKRGQPGISMEAGISTTSEIAVGQNVLTQNAEPEASSSLTFIIEDIVMQDSEISSPDLATQDVIMQDPDVPHTELYSMPGPSNNINMQHPQVTASQFNQPFTSGLYTVWGKERITKRRCMICVQAGREGTNCKGKNNRKRCEFI